MTGYTSAGALWQEYDEVGEDVAAVLAGDVSPAAPLDPRAIRRALVKVYEPSVAAARTTRIVDENREAFETVYVEALEEARAYDAPFPEG